MVNSITIRVDSGEQYGGGKWATLCSRLVKHLVMPCWPPFRGTSVLCLLFGFVRLSACSRLFENLKIDLLTGDYSDWQIAIQNIMIEYHHLRSWIFDKELVSSHTIASVAWVLRMGFKYCKTGFFFSSMETIAVRKQQFFAFQRKAIKNHLKVADVTCERWNRQASENIYN